MADRPGHRYRGKTAFRSRVKLAALVWHIVRLQQQWDNIVGVFTIFLSTFDASAPCVLILSLL